MAKVKRHPAYIAGQQYIRQYMPNRIVTAITFVGGSFTELPSAGTNRVYVGDLASTNSVQLQNPLVPGDTPVIANGSVISSYIQGNSLDSFMFTGFRFDLEPLPL